MLFLTKAKAQARIDAAVEAAMKEQAETLRLRYEAAIQSLQENVDQLRADHAEQVTELRREFEARIADERQVSDAGVQGLMEAVQDVANRPVMEIPVLPSLEPLVLPDYSPQILVLDERLSSLQRETRETTDTVQYLLDAPAVIERRVEVQHAGTMPGTQELARQHVRPMGAR